MQKKKTIFDVLTDITYNKTPWSEQDQKIVQPYMLNRFLSMNPDYLDIVAYCQPITDRLTSEFYYKFYLDVLPKKKTFNKYISAKPNENVNEPLVEFISERMQLGSREVIDILESTSSESIKSYILSHGFSEEQCKKKFNI